MTLYTAKETKAKEQIRDGLPARGHKVRGNALNRKTRGERRRLKNYRPIFPLWRRGAEGNSGWNEVQDNKKTHPHTEMGIDGVLSHHTFDIGVYSP